MLNTFIATDTLSHQLTLLIMVCLICLCTICTFSTLILLVGSF